MNITSILGTLSSRTLHLSISFTCNTTELCSPGPATVHLLFCLPSLLGTHLPQLGPSTLLRSWPYTLTGISLALGISQGRARSPNWAKRGNPRTLAETLQESLCFCGIAWPPTTSLGLQSNTLLYEKSLPDNLPCTEESKARYREGST